MYLLHATRAVVSLSSFSATEELTSFPVSNIKSIEDGVFQNT